MRFKEALETTRGLQARGRLGGFHAKLHASSQRTCAVAQIDFPGAIDKP